METQNAGMVRAISFAFSCALTVTYFAKTDVLLVSIFSVAARYRRTVKDTSLRQRTTLAILRVRAT